MASFGDALVFFLILLAIAIPVSVLTTEAMFDNEAKRNGFDTSGDFTINGCYVLIENGHYREFCKSDSGFLGWMDWWSYDDRQFFKDAILGFVESNPEPDCIYGVSYFKQIEKDGELFYEYQCVIP